MREQILELQVPTKLSFAVAMVPSIDKQTKIAVKTANPIDHESDILWYHVPVIYVANENRLYYYDNPSFFDKLHG